MKKQIKIVLIISGAILGLLILLILLGAATIQPDLNKMASIETQEIIEDVYAVQDFTALGTVNLYLIKSNNQYIAIDAGNDADHIQQELDKLNINAQDIVAVFLTHTDADHTAAVNLFNKATFYMSRAEEQMIDGRTSRFLFSENTFDHDYELVEDGQTINILGLKIQGILTPGHTPGSMSYLIDDKYLFAGDAVSLDKGQVYLLNESIYYMDAEAQRDSLERLANLSDVEYIFTGHHGFTTEHAKAFANWKR